MTDASVVIGLAEFVFGILCLLYVYVGSQHRSDAAVLGLIFFIGGGYQIVKWSVALDKVAISHLSKLF